MTRESSSDGSDDEMAGMMKMFASVSGKMSHTDGQHQCHGFGLRHTRLLVFLAPQAKGKVQGTALVLVRVQLFSTMGVLVVWTAGRCGQVGGADGQRQWHVKNIALMLFISCKQQHTSAATVTKHQQPRVSQAKPMALMLSISCKQQHTSAATVTVTQIQISI
eukprot:g37562.t1